MVGRGPHESAELAEALELVRAHPGYFMDDARAWMGRTDQAERARVRAIDARLTRAWMDCTTAAARERASELECIAAWVDAVACVGANQRDIDVLVVDSMEHGEFWRMTGSRLVRGLVNCESQNYLLACLLRPTCPDVEVFRPRDPVRGNGTHMLLRIRIDGREVFADAWGDVPLWTLDGPPLAGLPTLGALIERGLDDHAGVPSREEIRAGFSIRLADLQAPEPSVEAIGEVDDRRIAMPVDGSWTTYLRARAAHLFGDRAHAAALYAAAVETTSAPWLSRLASIHAARLGLGPDWRRTSIAARRPDPGLTAALGRAVASAAPRWSLVSRAPTERGQRWTVETPDGSLRIDVEPADARRRAYRVIEGLAYSYGGRPDDPDRAWLADLDRVIAAVAVVLATRCDIESSPV